MKQNLRAVYDKNGKAMVCISALYDGPEFSYFCYRWITKVVLLWMMLLDSLLKYLVVNGSMNGFVFCASRG